MARILREPSSPVKEKPAGNGGFAKHPKSRSVRLFPPVADSAVQDAPNR
jgi:hypothetical protein